MSDDAVPFGDQKPVADIRGIRVVVGATNILDRPKSSRLLKVRDFASAGFGKNYHFPLDDDVGLLFLEECLSPSRWAFATISTPIRPLDEACQNATILGWGKSRAVPDLLYASDGKLRSYVDRIQPYTVCQESYVDLNNGKVLAGFKNDIPFTELRNTISPDRHICHGGNTPSAACLGDSGGPVLVTDRATKRPVIIGVTSFGPTDTCSSSPNYAARVSTYALWIHEEIKSKSACLRYDLSNVFTSYPVTNRPQSRADRKGRCAPDHWQCQYSGACIQFDRVCDGRKDCDDASDESSHVCFGRNSAVNPFRPLVGIDIVGDAMGLRRVTSARTETDDTDDIDMAAPEDELDDKDDATLELIDNPGSVEPINTRLFAKWKQNFGHLVANYTDCPAAYALMDYVRKTHCRIEHDRVMAKVDKSSKSPRVAVTKSLLVSCDKLNDCLGGVTNIDELLDWIEHCSRAPDGVARSSLRIPSWIVDDFQPEIKFCKDARRFVEEETQRFHNAWVFAQKYDTLCQIDISK